MALLSFSGRVHGLHAEGLELPGILDTPEGVRGSDPGGGKLNIDVVW